jgi:hypothetical protein
MEANLVDQTNTVLLVTFSVSIAQIMLLYMSWIGGKSAEEEDLFL